MPTIVEACGASYPETLAGAAIPPMRGRSLVPIFRGETPQNRGALYWQWSKGKAVRCGHWRLVSDNQGPWELYDMRVDKTETNNLAAEFPEVVDKLDSMFTRWIKKHQD